MIPSPRATRPGATAHRLHDQRLADPQGRARGSQYPVLKQVADDLDLRNRDLVSAIKATTVLPRPVIPQYYDVSVIISREVKEVLDDPGGEDKRAEDKRDADKLKEIQSAVQDVLGKDAQ